MSRTQGAVGKKVARKQVVSFRCTEAEYAKIQRLLVAVGCSDLRDYLLLRIAISKEKSW